jgi:hypothetical protein
LTNFLIILPLHDHGISQDASIHFTWLWCRGPLSKVEGFTSLGFSTTKPCTSFKCLVNNHLAQYAIMQMPTLHFHFDLTSVHYLSFRTKLSGQRGVGGWEAWSISSSGLNDATPNPLLDSRWVQVDQTAERLGVWSAFPNS